MPMQDIIAKAREYALNEIKLYGTPKSEHFDLANEKWQMLAKKLSADKDIVMLWTILMDLKLGECFKEWKLQEHVARSSQAAKKFLQDFDIAPEKLTKIISCIEQHHGTPNYLCLEAEICANADCYRFLHPRWVVSAFILFGRRDESTDTALTQVEKKMDEKFSILSLPICKEELTPYYNQFKKFIAEAKSE